MKFNIKSRKGFTLIELLVVIGILAVLAAIAIPSVAGLIDRANQSSDATNSNEMTNAIERFASEYELYCQDIASGAIKSGQTSGFDSAQGRVYNVTKVTDRSGIERIEKPQSTKFENTGTEIAIYRDTKYPVNAATAHAIIKNYTKTSSSTFEPKQSDMHYWYSPDCGVVVVAEPNKTAAELDKYVISGMDAKGNDITSDSVNAQWIDLTTPVIGNPGEGGTPEPPAGNLIPAGAHYYIGLGETEVGDYSGATEVLNPGDPFPETVKNGDVYTFGDYEYKYNYTTSGWGGWYEETSINGWGVAVLSKTKSSYGSILNSINNKPITSITGTFADCTEMTTSPAIPSSVTSMEYAYMASGLVDASSIVIPNGVTSLNCTFSDCYELTKAPVIPAQIDDMSSAFENCTSIGDAPIIIHANPTTYHNCFWYISKGVGSGAKDLVFGGTSSMLAEIAQERNWSSVYDINGNVLKSQYSN